MHSRLTVLRAQPRPSLCTRQRLLGRQDAAVAQGVDVELEVALLAEQPEAVADLPGDLQRAAGSALRRGRLDRRARAAMAEQQRRDGAMIV